MMRTRMFFLCCACLCFPFFSWSQSAPAQELQGLMEQARYHKMLQVIEERLPQANRKTLDDWYYWQGRAYLLMEDVSAAQQSFQAGLSANRKSAINLAGMAETYFLQSQFTLATVKLGESQKWNQRQNGLEELLALGNACMAGVDYDPELRDMARVYWYQAQERFPESIRPDWELARFYESKKIWELAFQHYENLRQQRPDYAPIWTGLAHTLIELERYDEAASRLNQAIKLDPELPEVYRYRGELWLRYGELEKARKNYGKYLYYSGGDNRAWVHYAGALYLTGYYLDALKALDKVVDPSSSLAWVQSRLQGYCLVEKGDYALAREHLTPYWEQFPKRARLAEDYVYYGLSLIRTGDIEKGAEYLQRGVQQKPPLRTHARKLASHYLSLKQYPAGARYYALYVAAQNNPLSADYFRLGKIQYFAEQYELARQSLRNYLVHRASAEGYYWLGMAAYKSQDSFPELRRTEWRESFEKVVSLSEDAEELSEKSLRYFLDACSALAMYYRLPEAPQEPDCQLALRYARKVLARQPDAMQMQSVLQDCQ